MRALGNVIGVLFVIVGALAIRGFDWLPYSIVIGLVLGVIGLVVALKVNRTYGSRDIGWWGGGSTDTFDDFD